MHHSCLPGVGGKACVQQDASIELQASEVEAVLRDLPGHMCEELHLRHSAALQPRCAWGEEGLCVLPAHKEVCFALLHPKQHLSEESSPGGSHQLQLAGAVGGQQLRIVAT